MTILSCPLPDFCGKDTFIIGNVISYPEMLFYSIIFFPFYKRLNGLIADGIEWAAAGIHKKTMGVWHKNEEPHISSNRSHSEASKAIKRIINYGSSLRQLSEYFVSLTCLFLDEVTGSTLPVNQ